MVMSTEDNADVDVMRIYGDDFYTDTFLSPVYLRLIHDSATPKERENFGYPRFDVNILVFPVLEMEAVSEKGDSPPRSYAPRVAFKLRSPSTFLLQADQLTPDKIAGRSGLRRQ
ncbi:hypothetical protein NP493_877g01032 [Ridgeia piscesae]|uniref:Uncharacterized protein n=1 Tax=Ridgeia piscesae TaxID=27915 RepID=A0AAD9NK94_RIDPI|nr:hypothetical protein NP493_877g01032 [Ridgeia piscesae]